MPDLLSEQSYYRASSTATDYPPLKGSEDAAVCIVGGGFAGLATAMSLLERGETNIVLLEGETIGHGASGRNGGFVVCGFLLGERGGVGPVGGGAGRQLYQMTLDAVEQTRRRITAPQIECDARHDGIYLANWFNDARILDAQQAFMADTLGVEWQ